MKSAIEKLKNKYRNKKKSSLKGHNVRSKLAIPGKNGISGVEELKVLSVLVAADHQLTKIEIEKNA